MRIAMAKYWPHVSAPGGAGVAVRVVIREAVVVECGR